MNISVTRKIYDAEPKQELNKINKIFNLAPLRFTL